MIRLLFISTLSINLISSDEDHHMYQNSHNHDVYVQGEKLEVDQERFKSFLDGLTNSQVAVVNVNGMVCDFCARGIEKTFYNDNDVKKVKVSLEQGKVLIAYSLNKKVDLDEIKNIFLSNGQTATDIIIKNI